MNDKVRSIIKETPLAPGVYVFKNSDGIVIYVGKAKNLRNRLKNYVGKDADIKLKALQDHIALLEVIRTANEVEALILESNLVKKYKPRYNIQLKDDKAYPYIKINTKRDWPRLEFVRRVSPDGALYFGPYTSSRVLKELMTVLNKAFPLRKCSDTVFKTAKRPCLNYEIGRCMAPCAGLIKRDEYQGILDGVISVLKGNTNSVINALEKEMLMASDSLDFEEAAKARERVKALKSLAEGMAVVIPGDDRDIDVISVSKSSGLIAFNIMFLRKGALIGQANFAVESDDVVEAAIRFIVDYYMRNMVPDEILFPFIIDDDSIIDFIKKRTPKKVKILSRAGKDLKKIKALGEQNLELYVRNYSGQGSKWKIISDELSKLLGTSTPVFSVECFDMSNISGTGCVGAKVRFDAGTPSKGNYRKYKIKGDFKGDDLKMMHEVLSRRIARLDEDPLSDLVLIDGGRTQLHTVHSVFTNNGIKRYNLCSIAKDKTVSRGLSKDKIYHIDADGLVTRLNVSQTLLNFLKQVRDEAHRFVIKYHRELREKRSFE
jgi:excinuclease ABC subunit C